MLLLSACGGEDPQPSDSGGDDAEPTSISIGLNRNLLFLPIWVAQERGFFEEQNLDVEFTELTGGAELRTAILGGSLDFIAQSPEGSAILYEQGARLTNVVSTQGQLTWSLLLDDDLEDSVEAGNVEDLEGLTIGVSGRGAGSDVQLQALLRNADLVPDQDVTIVAIGAYAAGITAMQEGQIDGLMAVEPATSEGLAAGAFEFVFFGSGEVYPGSEEVPMGALATLDEYLQANEDVVRRVVTAIVAAESLMASDPDWVVEYATELTEGDADLLDTAVREQLLPALNPAISESGWATLVEILRDAQVVTQDVPYEDVTAEQFSDIWAEFEG